LTIYSGQLATELFVAPLPQVQIRALRNEVEIRRPASLDGFGLERTGNPAPLAIWSLISSAPAVETNWKKLKLSNCDAAAQFYRLRSEAP
jgi:hypothetical protein